MGLSPPLFVVLIVLATIVPPLVAGALLTRFVCRNFRDAAGVVEPKPRRCWFGLRRVRSINSNTTDSLATRAQSYADSWQDLESLRTHRDTPTPSLRYCTCEEVPPVRTPVPAAIRFQPQPPETWHPSRASRLTWSFSPTRRDQGHPRRSRSRLGSSKDSGVVLEGSSEEERRARGERASRRMRV
ncbi:uncharacterized protein LY79DRAFT_647156 [Colletotrichum navitas]|uniref:Uncharacterized protein n=1 Tax=Colletotrichum navitas TaxID=681940 RepID=A0AAD8QA47_9PEZI|nr:uncharacterized protein LY79DRAFT_647156 [Colletotrichum navitas]KAK1597344.1 hypothetical protein LY79DRAFT_647156 [Colletotrichum navitas]